MACAGQVHELPWGRPGASSVGSVITGGHSPRARVCVCVCVFVCGSLCPSLLLSFSLSLSHTHIHTYTLSLSLSLTHTHTHVRVYRVHTLGSVYAQGTSGLNLPVTAST